jgi:hypothetical protein
MLLKVAEFCRSMLGFLNILIVCSLCEIRWIRRFTEINVVSDDLLKFFYLHSPAYLRVVVLKNRDSFTF